MFPTPHPHRLLAATALLAAIVTAPGASAASITFKSGSFQTGSGGEFVALTDPSYTAYYDGRALQTVDGQTGFSTFCLERQEDLYFNQPYLGTLNDRAIGGGTDLNENPNLSGDPLSLGSAWLYLLFADGMLPDYDYGTAPYSGGEINARKADAGRLQNALWMLEDEMTVSFDNSYLALAVDRFGSLEGAQAANDGMFPVYVMNVTQGSTRRQDVLVRVPDGASMLGLSGLALGALALMRRTARPGIRG